MTDRGTLDFADEGRYLEARLRDWAEQAVSHTPGAAVARTVASAYAGTIRQRWLPSLSPRLVWLGVGALLLLGAVVSTLVFSTGHRPLANTVQPSTPASARPLIVLSAGQVLAVDVGTGHRFELGPATSARLSPNGLTVAFAAPDGLGVIGTNRSGRRILTDNTNCQVGPWSPDGQSLLTACQHDGPTGLLFMVRDVGPDGGVRPLGALTTFKDFGLGSWSPDSSRIVVPIEGRALDVTTGTGTAMKQLRIVDAGQPWLPRWSPDGALIAYAAGAIHVIHPDGALDRVLVERVTPCELRWSPDSRFLAYAAPSGGCPTAGADATGDAGVVDLDGMVRTIPSPVDGQQVIDLAWSSDGKRLALVVGPNLHCSDHGTSYGSVWVVNADGSNPVEVVAGIDCEWPDLGGPDW